MVVSSSGRADVDVTIHGLVNKQIFQVRSACCASAETHALRLVVDETACQLSAIQDGTCIRRARRLGLRCRTKSYGNDAAAKGPVMPPGPVNRASGGSALAALPSTPIPAAATSPAPEPSSVKFTVSHARTSAGHAARLPINHTHRNGLPARSDSPTGADIICTNNIFAVS